MSYLTCPHCHERISLFGPSGVERIAKEYGVPVLGILPVDPALSAAADRGTVEEYRSPDVTKLGDAFLAAMAAQSSAAVTTL
jgi:hypothetical protein